MGSMESPIRKHPDGPMEYNPGCEKVGWGAEREETSMQGGRRRRGLAWWKGAGKRAFGLNGGEGRMAKGVAKRGN